MPETRTRARRRSRGRGDRSCLDGSWPQGTPAGGDVVADDRRCPRPVGGVGIAARPAEPVEPAVDHETVEISVWSKSCAARCNEPSARARNLWTRSSPTHGSSAKARPVGPPIGRAAEHQVEQLHVLDEPGAEHAVAAGQRPREHVGLDRFERVDVDAESQHGVDDRPEQRRLQAREPVRRARRGRQSSHDEPCLLAVGHGPIHVAIGGQRRRHQPAATFAAVTLSGSVSSSAGAGRWSSSR